MGYNNTIPGYSITDIIVYLFYRGGYNMYDWIIIVFVAVWIFFMFRRGGCCGGHRNKNHDNSNESCCNNSDDIKDK